MCVYTYIVQHQAIASKYSTTIAVVAAAAAAYNVMRIYMAYNMKHNFLLQFQKENTLNLFLKLQKRKKKRKTKTPNLTQRREFNQQQH